MGYGALVAAVKGRSSGSPAFVPTQIAGLTLWAKTDTLSLSDGQAVNSWTDSSGNGYTLSWSGGGTAPTYKVNIQNGRAVVRFNGTTNWLQTAAFASGLQPKTIFLAYSQVYNGAAQEYVFDGLVNNQSQVNVQPGPVSVAYAGVNMFFNDTYPLAFNITALVFNGASSAWYRNNVSKVTGDTGTTAMTGITLGARAAQTLNSQIDVGEVIIYNSALSNSDRVAVQNYLNGRWAAY